MADVVITTNLTPYTLATCTFLLADNRANKTLDHFGYNEYGCSWEEATTIIDNSIKSFFESLQENILIRDNNFNKIYLLKQELLAISETYWDNILFLLNVVENIGIAEKRLSNLSHNGFETVGLSDKLCNSVNALKREILAFNEVFQKSILFHRLFEEEIAFLEEKLNETAKNSQENFSIEDDESKNIVGNYLQTLIINEQLSRKIYFKRNLLENVNVYEALKKNTSVEKKEQINIYDSFIQACMGVLSNIKVGEDTNYTLNDFQSALKTVAGYEAFQDFNVGDYEYQNALVRFLVEKKMLQSTPVLYDVAVHVDIDDTDDRGSLEITDTTAVTKVYYNKSYYNAPEVQITLKGGVAQSITPIIVSTNLSDADGRYFEVELRDANWNRTTGYIAWVSKGY